MPQDPHAEMGTPFSHDVHSSTRHSCQSRWIAVTQKKSKKIHSLQTTHSWPQAQCIARLVDDSPEKRRCWGGRTWTWRQTPGGFARSSHPLSDLTKRTGQALHQLSGAQSQLLIAAQRFADITGVSCMSK
jgi:hypothetical protein